MVVAGTGSVQQLLQQAQRALDDWQDAVDEALTLMQYDGTLDSDKTDEVVDECISVYDKIIALKDKVDSDNGVVEYNRIVDSYIGIWEDLQSILKLKELQDLQLSEADKMSFKAETVSNHVVDVEPRSKSVRFKDNIIESSPPVRFKPYKDTVEDFIDSSIDADLDNPSIDMSNKQIFIHNQNQFDYQDTQLENLHGSIRQQKQISQTINTELSEQFVILDDLESGIDMSNSRIIRANNRLTRYRNELKKRGDWMCIIILTAILLFLVLVL